MARISGGADYRDLREFYDKLQANFSQRQCEEFIEKCVKRLAGELLRRAVKKTPIGHYDGSSYVCETGFSHKGRKVKVGAGENDYKRGGKLRDSWEISVVDKSGMKCTITVFNDALSDKGVPYGIYVEYGHRLRGGGWEKGHFMLTDAKKELEEKAPIILRNMLRQKLRKAFK